MKQHPLKTFRQSRQLSLAALSELSGYGVSTINNFENGKTQVSSEFLDKMAKIFGVSVREITEDFTPPGRDLLVVGGASIAADVDVHGSDEKLESELRMLADQLPILKGVLKKSAVSHVFKIATELRNRWAERDDYWKEYRKKQHASPPESNPNSEPDAVASAALAKAVGDLEANPPVIFGRSREAGAPSGKTSSPKPAVRKR